MQYMFETVDHPLYYAFIEEFGDEYALTSNQPVAASSPWVGTALNSGTFAQATDESFAVAVLSGAATTDNSGTQIQGDMETFALVLGKETRFKTRLKLSDGTEDEVFAGLAITDTTLCDGTGTLAGGLTHTDSVGIYKPDGGTNVYGVIRRDSVQLSTDLGAFTMTDYNRFEVVVQMDATTAGKGYALFYVNGVLKGRLDSTTMPYSAEEILTPSLAFNSGNNTGTKTCTVDYIAARQQR